MKPRRDGRVRWSAWLGGCVSRLPFDLRGKRVNCGLRLRILFLRLDCARLHLVYATVACRYYAVYLVLEIRYRLLKLRNAVTELHLGLAFLFHLWVLGLQDGHDQPPNDKSSATRPEEDSK